MIYICKFILIYMYKYCIKIAGVYIAGLGITVGVFCASGITWSMLKKL